jgi:hypothetical protein
MGVIMARRAAAPNKTNISLPESEGSYVIMCQGKVFIVPQDIMTLYENKEFEKLSLDDPKRVKAFFDSHGDNNGDVVLVGLKIRCDGGPA